MNAHRIVAKKAGSVALMAAEQQARGTQQADGGEEREVAAVVLSWSKLKDFIWLYGMRTYDSEWEFMSERQRGRDRLAKGTTRIFFNYYEMLVQVRV